MPASGVDISGGSVKCVRLTHEHGHIALAAYGEVPLQPGVVVEGDIEKPDVIADILRSFRLKYRVRYANATLSEKKAFLYQILVPPGTASLREAVEFDLEAHVPLPPAETLYDYEVARQTPEGAIVSVTAFAKRVVETYQAVFVKAGIGLRALEVESHAIARAALKAKDRTRAVMLVDMGKKTTRIAVADHGVISYTTTMDLGGDLLTQALMKRFSIEASAAEEKKNATGFLRGKDNADVVEAVVASISVLRDELLKNIDYWNNPADDELPRTPVEKVIISGGNANVIGLAEYLADATRLTVVPAKVWQNAFSLDEYIPPMPAQHSLEYAPAIGLALRGAFNQSW